MKPLTPEDMDLIETVAESLGFHRADPGGPTRLSWLLKDSWNKHDIKDRLTTMTNTLALADLSVKAHQSAITPG